MSSEKHNEITPVPAKELVSKSTDFLVQYSGSSRLRSIQQSMVNPVGNFVLTNGNVRTTTIIPAGNVYNLAESGMKFEMLVAASGVAAEITKLWAHVPPIQSLTVKTSREILLQIDNFPLYWLASRAAYSYDKYLNHGSLLLAATVEAQYATGTVCRFHNPSGVAPTNALAAYLPNNVRADAAAALANLYSLGPTSPIMVMSGGAGNGATGPIGLNCFIKFDQLVHTFLACDKLLHIGEELQIIIDWAQRTNVGFTGDAVATLAPIAGGGALVAASVVTISNFNMFLATEQNELIRSKVMSESVDLVFPYPQVSQISLAAAVAGGSIPYTIPSQGLNLLRIYTFETMPDAPNTRNNAYNIPAAGVAPKTRQLQHRVNGAVFESQPLNTNVFEDYFEYYKCVEGGSMSQSTADYYSLCPVAVLEFAGTNTVEASKNDFQVVGGYGIAGKVDRASFQKRLTTGAAVNSNLVAIFQNCLTIRGGSLNINNSAEYVSPISLPSS